MGIYENKGDRRKMKRERRNEEWEHDKMRKTEEKREGGRKNEKEAKKIRETEERETG